MNPSIDITNVVLKTERLTLRMWKESDLDDFYEYASVDGVGEMAGWYHHKSKEESKEILKMFIEGKNDFALVYDGKVIGSCGIEKYDEEIYKEFNHLKGREVGYVLSKAYWGQGLMPEAVKAVIKYLYDVVGLDFITCGSFKRNNQSYRVQEKCGFKYYTSSDYHTFMGTIEPSNRTIQFKK